MSHLARSTSPVLAGPTAAISRGGGRSGAQAPSGTPAEASEKDRHAMGDKKSRRPAAFAVGATPDSPMRGQPPEEEWWPPGAEVWPSEAEDWPGAGGPPGNEYPGNGHPGNGYPGNGHSGNGHPGNGHPGNGQRSRNGQQAGAGYAPGHGRWPGNDGWRPHPGP